MIDVLIIDDDPSIRFLISEFLSMENFTCETAIHGKEGLEKLNAKCFRMVLLDLDMPVMNGYEFLEQKLLHVYLKNIPVVIQSASSTVIPCLDHVVQYIKKPYDVDQLLAAVNKCLRVSTQLTAQEG